jgi:hypothetical protein
MSTPQPDSALSNEAERLIQAELLYVKRKSCVLGISFLAGVVAAIAVWFLQRPMDRDDAMLSGVVGLAGVVWCLGLVLGWLFIARPDTNCPKCGYDWMIGGENPIDHLLTWKCCPGCGLKMRDEATCQTQPSK